MQTITHVHSFQNQGSLKIKNIFFAFLLSASMHRSLLHGNVEVNYTKFKEIRLQICMITNHVWSSMINWFKSYSDRLLGIRYCISFQLNSMNPVPSMSTVTYWYAWTTWMASAYSVYITSTVASQQILKKILGPLQCIGKKIS